MPHTAHLAFVLLRGRCAVCADTQRSRYKPGMSVRDDNADGVSVASRYTSRSRMSGMSGMSGMSRSRGPTMGGTTSRTARSSQLARTGRTMARGRRQFPARGT